MSANAFTLVRLVLLLVDAPWSSWRDVDLRRRWRARDSRRRLWRLRLTRVER